MGGQGRGGLVRHISRSREELLIVGDLVAASRRRWPRKKIKYVLSDNLWPGVLVEATRRRRGRHGSPAAVRNYPAWIARIGKRPLSCQCQQVSPVFPIRDNR